MARRTPKPFTVEVRKGGRIVEAAAAAWPADPTLASTSDDQPRMSWPGLDEAPEAAAEAEPTIETPQPTCGRVLPALGEPVPPGKVARPKRKGRGPVKPKPAVVEEQPVEVETSDLIELAPDPVEAEPDALAAEEPDVPAVSAPDTNAMAALMLQQGRKRLPREAFRRGERWKVRLPAAVHRRRKQTANKER